MYNYYLEHHGIKGQKWGRKNGPPYPLDASDHSAAEKKAGWRSSLNSASKEADKIVTKAKAKIFKGKSKKAEEKPKKDDTPEKKPEAPRKKAIEEMTYDELQKEYNLLKLQQDYKKLYKEATQTPEKKKGESWVMEKVIKPSAENIGKQSATYVMGKAANAMLKEIFEDENAVNPKKGQKDK